MGRTLVKIAGLVLGMLLIVSGLAKVATLGEFASAITGEIPLMASLGTVGAFAVVAAEVLSGAGFYFRRTRRLSGAAAAVLFFLFALLLLRKIMDGGDFACHCFGILTLQLSPILHFLFDTALMIVALLVAWLPASSADHYTPSRRLPAGFLVPLALCVLFLAWALLSAFRSPALPPSPEVRKTEFDIAFPVKPARAYRGTLVKGITSSGLLRPVKAVELIPKVSGPIVSARGYEGKAVSKGEILATIDRTAFRLAFERASFALLAAQIEYRTLSASPFLQAMDTTQARRDLQAAREHYQRVRTAYAAGRIDGPAYIRAGREYEAARAYFSANREDVIANRSGLAAAREAYERAKLELEATEIRAPFAGRIAGWEGTVGMQAHAGRPLCSLVDMAKLLVDVDIAEREAGNILPGRSAVITCMALPEEHVPGIVRTVSPVIDLKTRMMRATVELSPQRPSRAASSPPLRPGMFALVLIETDRLEGRLLVPREALLMRDQRQLAFTMEQGRAHWHYVVTGEQNQEVVEIRSGLSEGDTVIVEGHQALAHDARVFVKEVAGEGSQ